jgi:hypothetical protein
MLIKNSRLRFYIFASLSLVPIVLLAAITCPWCVYHPAEETICETTCDSGVRLDNSPAFSECSGTGTSSLECFSNEEPTVITITDYAPCVAEPPGTCPDCGWYVVEVFPPYDAYECWNDDTGCGGNG